MRLFITFLSIFILTARNGVKAQEDDEIRPTDDPPGNNLVIGNTHLQTDFQAASPIYSPENKNKNRQHEGNSLLSPRSEDEKNSVQTQALVWDNCLETFFRDNQDKTKYQNFDMEHEIEDLRAQQKQNGSLWNKRDTVDPNRSISVEKWIEKYKNLTESKSAGRRQLKTDPPTKATTASSTVETTTIKVIPITRKVFDELTEIPEVTISPVTKNDSKVGYTKDWIEVKDRTKIRFTGLPRTENYLIPSLKLDEGFYPFSFMSEFFSFIHPFDFPIGLIKDIVWGQLSFPSSFLQSIKVESTFLTIIIIFTCIALVIPAYLIILGILKLLSKSRCDDEVESGALFPDAEDSECNDRMLVLGTLFVILICSVLISGMAVSNEQANAAMFDSDNVVRCACADLSIWLSTAARELYHSIVPPVDLVAHAFKEDLKNIESLLGEPIQKAIASESGIELALDSLTDITTETEDLSKKITNLRDVSMRAGSLASVTSDRIKDLGRQIESLKKTCNMKDLPLCDTIKTNALEMQIKFDLVLRERRLLELRTLGVENLTEAILAAKHEFKLLPSAISKQTTQIREDLLYDVETRKQSVHASSRIINDIARHLSAGLHTTARVLGSGIKEAQQYETWRWTAMIASVLSFLMIMILIVTAMLCGCGKAQEQAKRTLQVSTIWLGLLSLLLWVAVSSIFLISGHAEIYVCHALWDAPQYKTLSALLDKPSPMVEGADSVFTFMLKEVENVTIDVSVRDVLRDCERDQPAYLVFQLDKVFDVNKETSYFEWVELQRDLGRFSSSIDVGILKTISVYFGRLLSEMTIVSDVNLAKYRLDYNNPVVGKDIPSLIDQLETVASQVTDLTTAGRLETLATRAQRLYLTNIKPLEQLRADVVFKLTELELQLSPFRRKLNVSLSHINTAQYYINNQGDVIAQRKISIFISRLLSHAAAWRSHVLASTSAQAARCRPLFNVFAAARTMLCTRYVSSLHGWWVCGFFLGLLWCTALTPLCVKLWRVYARKIKAEEAMILANLGAGQQTPTTALCESGSNWNTPGPPPPPRSDSW